MKLKWISLCLVFAPLIFSCAAYQQTDLDHISIVGKRLAVGHFIHVKTYSDQEYSFTITKIDETNLYGEELVIAIADIRSVEKKSQSDAPSLWMIILLSFLLLLYQDLGSEFF